ncbi:MAG: cobyric acid synthase [Thermoplasmata archaeon]
MVLGTASGAGKSLLVTAMCRIFSDIGIDVAPFKVQNMSLNAIAVQDGEMAYAQYLQALAARVEPTVLMNPILLKPENDRTHVVLLGKHYKTIKANNYMNTEKEDVYRTALKSFETLQNEHELIVIEGAGSPAEINLAHDIANLKFANAVGAKVVLVADIDRGGAFASIVGTLELIDKKNMIGIIINKFRGDESLLYPGFEFLEKKYHIPVLGTIPYISHAIPDEDSLRSWPEKEGSLRISIIKIPNLSNFTDFNVFEHVDDVGLRYVDTPEHLSGSDLIIVPGSKLTVLDLAWLKERGFEEVLKDEKNNETMIMGICGGYQMLGKYIIDNVESRKGKVAGIGILDSKTVFRQVKHTNVIYGTVIASEFENLKIKGYEIHNGVTISKTHFSKIYRVNNKHVSRFDGSYENNVIGTYFHGLFENLEFTEMLINMIRAKKSLKPLKIKFESVEASIDNLAKVVKKSIKIDELI